MNIKLNRLLGRAAISFALGLSLITVTPLAGHDKPAYAQGPASVADLAEGLMSSVVNISTAQKVEQNRPNFAYSRVPEGSPFQEFFEIYFPSATERESGACAQRTRQSLDRVCD